MEIIPKRFSEEDIKVRVDWINNSAINSQMYFDLPAKIANTRHWFENNLGNNKRVDATFLFPSGERIAMGGFTSIDGVHSNAEFYVMVNPILQGQGIGKRVSRWLFNYGFSVLKLNKIYLYTNDDNVGAYRIYENSGFVLEGILRNHKWKNGVYHNRRVYGLLQSEWDVLNWKKIIANEL